MRSCDLHMSKYSFATISSVLLATRTSLRKLLANTLYFSCCIEGTAANQGSLVMKIFLRIANPRCQYSETQGPKIARSVRNCPSVRKAKSTSVAANCCCLQAICRLVRTAPYPQIRTPSAAHQTHRQPHPILSQRHQRYAFKSICGFLNPWICWNGRIYLK